MASSDPLRALTPALTKAMGGAADEVIEVYRRHADAWTRARGANLPEVAWLDSFSALLPSAGSVLDLRCGSGAPVARDLTRRGLSATGVDSAPEMVAMFKANFRKRCSGPT